MTNVIVSGAIANKCFNGGATWTRLNWILGFKKLGFNVFFVEQINEENCVDASGKAAAFEESANLAYFKRVTEEFGIADSSALICDNGKQSRGLTFNALVEVAESSALLVNITGHLSLEPLKSLPRLKAYVDLDPGFTQFWAAKGEAGPRLDGHDFYFTVGENINSGFCPIPTAGIRWLPIRQPVVLDCWPVSTEGRRDRFTTIASWRGPYGPVEHGGKRFGLKVHEFRKFIELPRRAPQQFEIALDIHPAEENDLRLLRQTGWQIVDPREAAGDPSSFRRYVQSSGAEFSVAQGIYVETESGWFSDRTTRYLASGKPALVEDTGFSRNLPTGEGLIAFRSLDDAVAGAETIARDYEKHCRAARRIAEACFDSNKTIGKMIEYVGLSP